MDVNEHLAVISLDGAGYSLYMYDGVIKTNCHHTYIECWTVSPTFIFTILYWYSYIYIYHQKTFSWKDVYDLDKTINGFLCNTLALDLYILDVFTQKPNWRVRFCGLPRYSFSVIVHWYQSSRWCCGVIIGQLDWQYTLVSLQPCQNNDVCKHMYVFFLIKIRQQHVRVYIVHCTSCIQQNVLARYLMEFRTAGVPTGTSDQWCDRYMLFIGG